MEKYGTNEQAIDVNKIGACALPAKKLKLQIYNT